MEKTVLNAGWDGEWFLRAYDHYKNKIGSKECEDGKIFIEPQGFCVMAEIGLKEGNCLKAMESVEKYLDTKYGIVLLQPPYHRYHVELGEISSYPPGYKENAGIFCHNNPWISIAETVVGRGNRAWQVYTRTCPAYIEDISEIHRTEPICQAVDSAKADMTIFDSSGIEAFVTENNPKYANRIIRQLKAYAKANSFDKNFDPYKAAYGSMPSHASANPEIKQLYINGHFCYVFKFGIITNGLGIIRHIAFYNKNFIASHPDITVEKKSDSPDEDKSVHDSRLLIPTLKDFFLKHPLINPKTFLGDAAFDTAALYPKLLTGNTFGDHKHFDKAYIPLNSRAGLEKQDYTINENGIPCCPHDDSLPMKYEGVSKLRSGVTRYKFVCPKIKWIKNASTGRSQRHCTCDDPCTASSCGRMVYIYPEKNLRAYPGAIRGTEEWNNTYKIRTTVERDINHIKDNLCLAGRRTQNEKTLHADLILAGITQLITVVLSDKINHHEFIRSLKPLIA